eukprot:evm.model.scf_362EXC.15 EVM.evm.TU.scf_362EXC.15   scf_362EXC:83727-89051(+)
MEVPRKGEDFEERVPGALSGGQQYERGAPIRPLGVDGMGRGAGEGEAGGGSPDGGGERAAGRGGEVAERARDELGIEAEGTTGPLASPVLITRPSSSKGNKGPLVCQVQGCNRDLSTEKKYYKRYRVCMDHLKMQAICVDGNLQRFCQQCGRFHDLDNFDGDKRYCPGLAVWWGFATWCSAGHGAVCPVRRQDWRRCSFCQTGRGIIVRAPKPRAE